MARAPEERKPHEGCAGCGLSFMCGSHGRKSAAEPFGAPETRAIVLGLAIPVVLFMGVLLLCLKLTEAWVAIVAAFAATLLWLVIGGRIHARCRRKG